MSLITELRRRNVFKVGAAYLVVGWLVIEAAALLAPQLNLPEWAPRFVTFLVLVGFPIALVLAWIFDLTPEGVQLAEGRVGNKRFYAVVSTIAVLSLAWFFVSPGARSPSPGTDTAPPREEPTASQTARPGPGGPSIAVLPFVNMSPDPENEFFADGISEELLNILARIEGLTVASRTSAFSFKGSNVPIPTIASNLNVGHVLEGSVRKQADRVRITAQLVRADSDVHLWSQTYDRRLVDIFAVQEEIAQAIATALEGVLGTRVVAVTAPTRDLEAYQRFLQGRARFFQRRELDEALADFQFAVARDAQYAEAWGFLAATAYVHARSAYPSRLDPADIEAPLAPALERALALNPDMSLAVSIQGSLMLDSKDPERMAYGISLMERAAAAELGDSSARMWLGLQWLMLGHADRARPVLASAHEDDPMVAINAGYLGLAGFVTGREADGERLARRAVELSGWTTAAMLVSGEMANRGEPARSVEWFGIARADLDPSDSQAAAADYQRALADPAAREAYLATLPEVFSFLLLFAFADADAIFARIAAETRWIYFQYLVMASWLPSMQWLREDPRYFALMDKHGYIGTWERIGYPRGCRPVNSEAGRKLECAGAAP
jgi:TolB-like protein